MRTSYQLLARRVGIVAAALTGMVALVAPAMNPAHAQATLPTTTTVTATPSTTPSGNTVVLTAVVSCPTGGIGEPTGTVSFFDTTTAAPVFLGTAPLVNTGAGTSDTAAVPVTATFSSPPAAHTVTGVYSGDALCRSSQGTTTVTTTTTTVAVTPSATVVSPTQTVTFTAVVTCTGNGDPTGSVTFTDLATSTVLATDTPGISTGTNQRTFTSGPVTLTVPPSGPHQIQATYTSTNAGCSNQSGTTTVNVETTTTTVTSPSPVTVGATTSATATVTCTAGSPAGGTVVFFDGMTVLGAEPVTGTSPASVTLNGITFSTPGTHTITAVYTDNANCSASSGTTTVVANLATGTSTTTVTATPANPLYGQPVTLTATVTCATGSPTGGTVTFTDLTTGTVLGSQSVNPSGTASITTNGLLPGPHNIQAAFGGTATCGATTGTVTVTVSSSQTISGDVFHDVIITTPTTFAPGTHVFGNVLISGSGSLVAEGVTIVGRLTATGGTGLRLCGSSVGGSTSISGMNGVIVIGDGGDDGQPVCAGNNLAGSVNISNNTGFVEFSGNNVGGSVTVNNNTTTIAVPPENATATELEVNHIGGSLSCTANGPLPPTNDGMPNVASGSKSGQCAAL